MGQLLIALSLLAGLTLILLLYSLFAKAMMELIPRFFQHNGMNRLTHLLSVLLFISYLLLLISGFGSIMIHGSLTGYYLLFHISISAVFALLITCFAIVGCLYHSIRFRLDYQMGESVCFWGMLIVSLPVMLTAVLPMFPWFNTEGQNLLLSVHLTSSALFSLLIFCYILFRLLNSGKLMSN